ncbi:NAD(P)/FAD-dependent oxidoreductase [Tsukamurella sp. 8F]|uniref:flavin monoamine oxidase family protein n=1 Tax=unclassified Tsukamurella TaxID=2633480 RepID=UPI0023B89CFD|nr:MULTISPECIES: NAD(P)/FAD-dependent oxidoreductase [unclassified Tsukamurella]MDF0529647.1 NAD(P)/FAD-dependent oxidoreductase [Tsukamurella sp. 8J]MDF0585932.1 NAD(P)/FAD-dependent oxidoreductase [Tsukamurella sp. 8F]
MTVDVVVVGAGASGLTAASDLAAAGFSVQVIEARDRIGGRIHTVPDRYGHPIEYGAEFVGPHQRTMLALAEQHGLRLAPTWDDGQHIGTFGGSERRWAGDLPGFGPRNLLGTAIGVGLLDTLARTVAPATPWAGRLARRLDRRTVADWLRSAPLPGEASGLLEAAMRSIFAADMDEISLLHALMCIRSAGGFRRYIRSSGAQQLRFVDGAGALCERLMATVPTPPILGVPVTAVADGSSGAVLTTETGTLRADRVVLAVPPRHAAAIAFDPPLPEGRSDHLRAARPGTVLKYHLAYDEPFWRAAGLSGKTISNDALVNATFDFSTGDQGVLAAFVVGGRARRLLAENPQARLDAVLADLAERFGPAVRRPVDAAIHVWNEDPWSPGCFAGFQPPGSWTSSRSCPSRAHGRVHFAGTETATRFHGAMEGAVSSGRRAAAEVAAALRR